MKQQILSMLEMQDAMNSKVHSDWRERGFEWYRAIWVECAELMDHYGWKWWKHQQPDTDQVKLELVDIWHFGLSILLLSGKSSDQVADDLSAQLAADVAEHDFRRDLEHFTQKTLESRGFDVEGFNRLLAAVEMNFEELYVRYVGKNVLNFFRQDHGYKEGSYIKVWDGREDNEHLVEAASLVDTRAADFKDQLYRELKTRYPV